MAASAMSILRQVFWLRGPPIHSAFPLAGVHRTHSRQWPWGNEWIVARHSGATAAE
jgi:hypothetical protein